MITPDWSAVPVPVPYADLTDPQSLNQYSYVRNIPTSKTDPDGHQCPPCPTLPMPTPEEIDETLEVERTLDSVQRGAQVVEEGETAVAGTAARGRLLGPGAGIGMFLVEMIFPDSVDSGEIPSQGSVPRVVATHGQMQQMKENQTQAPVIEDKRKNTKTIRREWEKAKGKKWPKDKDGKNYDGDHKNPLADGGSNNAARNIQPRTRRDHVNRHKRNGDFKRWAKRRNKQN